MTIVLREMTRVAADAILAGERPSDVRVADDYPTEFSAGVAQCVGAERQFGPFLLHRSEDDVVVGEIGGAFVDEDGTIEIGYAVVESGWNRGYATAAVEALVTRAREASEVRRIVAHTPHERPQSGRVLEKAGFAFLRDMDDADEAGNVMRVREWELDVQAREPAGLRSETVAAVGDKAPEQAVLAQERALQAAMLASDVDALDRLLHPELLAIGPDGQPADKAMDLDAHRTGVFEIAELTEEEVRVRVVGETALTFVVLAIRGTIGGADASGRYRYTRTWTREGGAWRVVGAHISPAG
jgi:RimJ/RimL family protein N-acetyltransferase/ketosteroid isomerase-like protein